MTIRILNWNVEWATKTSPKGKELLRRISEAGPDVICLTEAHTDFLPESETDQLTTSSEDCGYEAKPSQRKVVLWSKEPWNDVDDLGSEDLPPGRFVSGVTKTPIGDVLVIGVCIPWFDAHVRDGHKNRERWEDHRLFLDALERVLARLPLQRTILVGDYNQRFPKRQNTPPEVFVDLQRAVASKMTIATSAVGFQGKRTIDHLALSEDLVIENVRVLSNLDEQRQLSDHFGIVADVSAKSD